VFHAAVTIETSVHRGERRGPRAHGRAPARWSADFGNFRPEARARARV